MKQNKVFDFQKIIYVAYITVYMGQGFMKEIDKYIYNGLVWPYDGASILFTQRTDTQEEGSEGDRKWKEE